MTAQNPNDAKKDKNTPLKNAFKAAAKVGVGCAIGFGVGFGIIFAQAANWDLVEAYNAIPASTIQMAWIATILTSSITFGVARDYEKEIAKLKAAASTSTPKNPEKAPTTNTPSGPQ
jgi:hypothetical protein